jgi:hypothetical protein
MWGDTKQPIGVDGFWWFKMALWMGWSIAFDNLPLWKKYQP